MTLIWTVVDLPTEAKALEEGGFTCSGPLKEEEALGFAKRAESWYEKKGLDLQSFYIRSNKLMYQRSIPKGVTDGQGSVGQGIHGGDKTPDSGGEGKKDIPRTGVLAGEPTPKHKSEDKQPYTKWV